jgi:hypothetical protein
MIAVASSQVGYREGADNDNAFGRWYGMNRVAWCAEFVSWAAALSGCGKAIPKHAYTPAGAAWFKARKRWGTKPKVGAIAYFYNASLRRIAHVGVVVKVSGDGSFVTVEGNTSNTGSRTGNGVYKLHRTGTRGGGFGYPAYAAPPAEKPPVDLSNVVAKAKEREIYDGRVAAALEAEGLRPDVSGYARWQRRLGYEGADADGIAGEKSLAELGKRHGWSVRP